MKKTIILASSISLALASITSAQSAQNDELTDPTEVVSVTATKQSLRLFETPDSVSTVLQQEIADVSPQHINQILARTPGTWISRGNGQEHLTAIRSPVLTGAGSCGAFFMGLDNISIRAPGFCNSNQLFDVNYEQAARVDVLRSPASTLYGGNALHGVINVITPDAFAQSNNSASINIGANDFTRISNVYGKQSSDTSAWLNLVNITNENGYQTESGYDQQKMTHIYQVKGDDWSSKSVLDVMNLNQQTAGFIRGFESYKDEAIRRVNPNPEAFRKARSLRAYNAYTTLTDYGELTITPYIRANEMSFLQHFLPWQALEENRHASLGVQSNITYTLGDVNLISGFDIDYTHGSLVETQDDDFSPSIPAGLHYDYKVKATQIAGYTQALWALDNWQFRVGARVERNHYNYDNKAQGSSACEPSVEVCRFSRPDDQSLSFTAVSPSANAQYQINDTTLWYVKYSQGFRAPQATELFRLQNNQQVSDIDNESMDAIETGLRWRSASSSLHVAAFHMQKDDVIFQNTNRQNVTGGETQHQGVELEFRHAFSPQLSVNGHVSYAEHTYENNLQLVNAPIVGNLIDTSPKWMSQFNAVYQASDNISARLSWQFLDAYYLDPQNTAEYEGYSLIDLHLNYAISANIKLSLHVLNIADNDYAERADFAFGGYRYFVGQPRRTFVNFVWNY
jgi:iron complex outermembrane receptor protein